MYFSPVERRPCSGAQAAETVTLMTATVRGDVAAVKAAVDAGVRGGEKVGEVIATHVIARPHTNVDLVLPLGRLAEAEAETGAKKK